MSLGLSSTNQSGVLILHVHRSNGDHSTSHTHESSTSQQVGDLSGGDELCMYVCMPVYVCMYVHCTCVSVSRIDVCLYVSHAGFVYMPLYTWALLNTKPSQTYQANGKSNHLQVPGAGDHIVASSWVLLNANALAIWRSVQICRLILSSKEHFLASI